MAKTAATAKPKKSKRRMKKQVRKTLGALFLASAIGVAAIPTGSIQGGQAEAANSCNGTNLNEYYILKQGPTTDAVKNPISEIPYISDLSTTVYTTGDQKFMFAYVNSSGVDEQGDGTNKFAVILGYDPSGAVDASGNLTIPAYVQSYKKLSDSEGYCLASVSGDFLFYSVTDTIEFTLRREDADTNPNPISSSEYYSKYTVGGDAIYSFLQEYIPPEYRQNPGYYQDAKPNKIGLFEKSHTKEYTDDGVETGYTNYVYTVENVTYSPCTYANSSNWNGVDKDKLYYRTSTGTYELTNLPEHQYVDNIPVRYIGNQFSEYDNDSSSATYGTYKISSGEINDDNPGNGVFADTKGANIVNLTIPETMEGIGDYAFYRCVALRNISFANGLVAIGNHAFEGCRSLASVGMPESPRINTIGAYAFKDCPSLTSFYVPHSIKLLCDGVFENCSALTSIDLTGDINSDPTGTQASLQYIGNHLFYGCSALESATFGTVLGSGGTSAAPVEISINIFENCPSLRRITVLSNYMTFVDDEAIHTGSVCGFVLGDKANSTKESFHAQLSSSEFYFEGTDPPTAVPPVTGIGTLHKMCQERDKGYEFTYKYYGQELYEKTVTEEGGGKAVYQVDNTNSLVGFVTVEDSTKTVTSLSFPANFGPYHIAKIPEEKCMDLCRLEEVSIPANVEEIGARAFKGCHNLKYVYFGSDQVTIGDEAFKTQQTTLHRSNCPDGLSSSTCPANIGGDPKVQLYFVTTVSSDSTPFNYAMSPNGKFSHPQQNDSWPIIFSGFPTLLEISYNEDKNCAELIDFPTLSSLPNYYTNADYLSAEEKAAIYHFLNEGGKENPTTTYDKQLDAVVHTLTVPKGVASIEDGLFYKNTHNDTGAKTDSLGVVSDGIKEIDVDLLTVKTANSRYGAGITTNPDAGESEDDLVYNDSGTYKRVTDPINQVSAVDVTKSDFAGCDSLTGITMSGISTLSIPAYGFADCENLAAADLTGVTSIGDHAFQYDKSLSNVNVSADTTSLGKAPFYGCDKLTNVAFASDNTKFKTDNSIIYGYDDAGNKQTVVEFLKGRTAGTVQPRETTGIISIAEEAFANTGVDVVNFENASFTSLPTDAFADCADLNSVTLPQSCGQIKDYAFERSNLKNLTIMNSGNFLVTEAGMGNINTLSDPSDDSGADHGGTDQSMNYKLNVYAPAETDDDGNVISGTESVAYQWYEFNKYTVNAYVPIKKYYITYWDYASADATKRTIRITDEYEENSSVTVRDPLRTSDEGFNFEHYEDRDDTDITYGYSDQFVITRDYALNAVYSGVEDVTYTATFYDVDPATGLVTTAVIDEAHAREVYSATDTDGSTYYYVDSYDIPASINAPDGYTFQGWGTAPPTKFTIGGTGANSMTPDSNNIVRFTAVYAMKQANTHTVTFWGYDAETNTPNVKIAGTYTVEDGGSVPQATALAYAANVPKPDTTFKEWNKSYSNIFSDTHIYAVYNDGSGGGTSSDNSGSSSGGSGTTSGNNSGSGDSGNSSGSGSSSGNGSSSGSGSSGTTTSGNNSSSGSTTKATYYTLTVVNGSGSGSYIPGSQVIVVANDPASGKVFSSWTISPENTSIASKAVSATVVTMPSSNVTVTANYKAGSNSGNTSSSNNTTRTPGSTTTNRKGGTTVVIDKNGLSNTGVVSATVNGSSDNFTIKVSESSSAAEAAVRALTSAYGDISAIRYFPMDISLYDSTGQTKITDTSGLSITLTLPIPDSLVQYGGNNKVASTSNNYLENLGARFTTISGVPCITFTCEHFSPYVIYVDTNNLNASSMIDDTPKTADGIHPKWFLSAGLAAMSVVLFLKKDRKQKVKVKK